MTSAGRTWRSGAAPRAALAAAAIALGSGCSGDDEGGGGPSGGRFDGPSDFAPVTCGDDPVSSIDPVGIWHAQAIASDGVGVAQFRVEREAGGAVGLGLRHAGRRRPPRRQRPLPPCATSAPSRTWWGSTTGSTWSTSRTRPDRTTSATSRRATRATSPTTT